MTDTRVNVDTLIKPEAAAAILGTTPGVLRNWRHEGRGPSFVRVGRSVRYRTSDLAAYVADLETVEPVGAGR